REYTLVFRSVGKFLVRTSLCPIIAAIHELSGLDDRCDSGSGRALRSPFAARPAAMTAAAGIRSAGTRVSRRLRLPVLGSAVTRRAERWARKRQGTDATSVRLRSRRIYILPTGVGAVFGLTTFAMLLGSMNYNNN